MPTNTQPPHVASLPLCKNKKLGEPHVATYGHWRLPSNLQYTELSLSRGTDGDVATADASASGEMKKVVRSEWDRDTALLSFVPFSFVTGTTALTSMDHTNTTQQQLTTQSEERHTLQIKKLFFEKTTLTDY